MRLKLRKRMLAALGALFLGVGALVHLVVARPERNTVFLAGSCEVPATIIEPAARGGNVTAIVFHGLSANRRLMTTLGQSLAWSDLRVILVDLPGHGDNSDAFSIERCEECAGALLDSFAKSGEINPDRTVLIGHSLGGALAMRMADRVPVAATVAISPAPMVPVENIPADVIPMKPPHRMPANLLIVMGQLEPERAKQAAQKLIEMAGGQRHVLEDFRQRRAARLIVAPYATHTSLLINRRVWDVMDVWWRMATPVRWPTRNFFGYTLYGGMISGVIGLAFLFALAVRVVASGGAKSSGAPPPRTATVLVVWLMAAALGGGLSYVLVPLRVLRIFGGSLLASVLAIVGVIVLAYLWRAARAQHAAPLPSEDQKGWAVGAALGLATVLAFSAWLGWQATDVWMNGARWWRFALLAPLLLLHSLAEEKALGWERSAEAGAANWGGRLRRYFIFFLLRLMVLLAVALPLGGWQIERVLILLLTPYLVIFSVGQRLGADAVRRESGSLAAAAVFSAILAAWFIAGVFPITG